MARLLNLSFGNTKSKFKIQKIDRKKLYGYTLVDVKDDNDLECELASVSDDGKYILTKGCTSYVYLNGRNEYVTKDEIQIVDKNNNPLDKIQSSFELENIDLVPGTLEDYLRLYVKATYQLVSEEESSLSKDLDKHKLLYFKFNYRTDYDYDDAYILQNDGNIFMVIGQHSPFDFIGLEAPIESIIEEGEDEDDLDFGML